ncbi:hypothetical protein C0Q70_13690 [Pomacea canaliculata]|uniref:Consortin N-terminal domain-containing protein n=1 Tax=Pomacea canaliculata TaxID=400727 RepID=A0A2T7NXY0_POMCA|nr:hypothetical protein C0Q70_13690 [Pomacea canaliculata]
MLRCKLMSLHANMDGAFELSHRDENVNSANVIKVGDYNSSNCTVQELNNEKKCPLEPGEACDLQETLSDLECPKAGNEHVSEESVIKGTKTSLGDKSALDAEGRNQLFAQGVMLDRQGKKEEALKHYLNCLFGLSRETRFVLLPQCLRNIAEIYYEMQEYDKAIHFIQAEKLYYENALINTEEIQKKLDEMQLTKRKEEPTTEVHDLTAEVLRAEEFEHLAKLCMDHKQPQLAMEYAGKCSQMRQQVLGEHHPKTKESLDLFASLYAEAGKQQYIDSLEAFSNGGEDGSSPETQDSEELAPVTPTLEGSPVSILRHRKNSDREKKQVRFHESVVDPTHRQQGSNIQSSYIL